MAKSKIRQILFQVYKEEYRDDDYSMSSIKTDLKEYPTQIMAERELDSLKNQHIRATWYTSPQPTSYGIKRKPVLVDPSEAWQHYPDYIVHLDEVDPIVDTCGQIKELIATPNMSMAYFTLNGTAKEHKHDIMEEFYYITKGRGTITIADKTYDIDEGHSVNIPKGEWHYLKGTLEGIVTTHPRFNPEDVILR